MFVEVAVGGMIAMTAITVLREYMPYLALTTESTLDLIFKRSEICVEKKERPEIKDKKFKKLYPKLIKKSWENGNEVLFYRLPHGLSYKKITKNLDVIESYLKCEVLPKFLENHPKAHFSLTILSGHLLNYVEFTDEHTKLPDNDGLWIPIGWSRRGLEMVNLAEDNCPHIMVGGGTGAGKSKWARLALVVLHMKYGREHVRLWLSDLKHGVDTAMLGDNPLLVDKVIRDPEEVEDVCKELQDEVGKRYQLFRDAKCTDIRSYNKKYKVKLPHIIAFFDELTKLEGNKFKQAREEMTKLTGEARGAGVHVIVSCHRPTANLVSGTMKNNIPVVIAFRCNPVSARVLLGEDEWESSTMIDKDINGRALLKWKDEVLVQVPLITDELCESIMAKYQKPKKPDFNHLEIPMSLK